MKHSIFFSFDPKQVQIYTKENKANITNGIIRNELMKWPFSIGHESNDGDLTAQNLQIYCSSIDGCSAWHDTDRVVAFKKVCVGIQTHSSENLIN